MKGLSAAAASAAVLMLSGGSGALAADLATKAPVYKAPVSNTCTSILDFFTTACQVSAYGVRFYGTIDVDYSYQTHGAPLEKYATTGLTWQLQKMNNAAESLFAANALSQSNVGFLIKEPLAPGWSFVGQVQVNFDPATLYPADGSQSLRDDFNSSHFGGVPQGQLPGVADSSNQGKFYNGGGYFGVSNDVYGTLTFFRQSTLMGDALGAFDPLAGAYAFSLVSGNGSLAAGGSTEFGKGTTAVKYRVNLGNYHLGAFWQFGGYDLGNSTQGMYQGDIGADYHVGPGILSLEGVGGFSKDAVLEGLGFSGTDPNTGIGSVNGTATGITATISNDAYVRALAKYTVGKLKLYAGYTWYQFSDPSDSPTSFTDIAGNDFVAGSTFGITTNAYINGDKVENLEWVGGRYTIIDGLDFATGYYHVSQNESDGGAATCATNARTSGKCAGTEDLASAVLDWKFAPKWDTYVGTMYMKLHDGMANGYIADTNWVTTLGLRFKW